MARAAPMTFIKARVKGQTEWQYITADDTLTNSPRLAAIVTDDEARTFLARAAHEFPEWECEVEEWDMQDWLNFQS
jgi:hypothetical protein